jgi:hypothetical protein
MWRTAVILAGMVLVAAEGAAARAAGDPGSAGGAARGPGRGGPVVDEEMRAALEQVMRVRIKKALQLSPEQEGRVMPRVEKLQEARHDFASRRRAAVSHLRALMIDETARPEDVGKALREVRDLEASFREREEDLRAEINAELDARQQAQLYFFEVRFRRDIQRRFTEESGRREGRTGRGRGHGGPPAEAPGPQDEADDEL